MSEVMNRQKTRNLATRDKKRYFWWLPLFIAISPIVGIEFYKTTGNAIYAWFTPILWYLFVPLGDFLFGRDDKNYSAQRADELENDNYYKWLVFLSVPLFFVTWMYGAWWVSTQAVSVSDYLGMTIGVALTNGLALVVGHELGHKNNRLEKSLTVFLG